ncbi:hypothetical protein B0H16DRAFT_1456970 [Mycena metata]|uniref:Uncharacterized protein n=1 Tax=Mycena metata TaxID=1033252 RepID=A0AAD7NFQ8_9AGAR|nr:hypothetical protein B0H16DRAFT_1456970 [Mycena metata]
MGLLTADDVARLHILQLEVCMLRAQTRLYSLSRRVTIREFLKGRSFTLCRHIKAISRLHRVRGRVKHVLRGMIHERIHVYRLWPRPKFYRILPPASAKLKFAAKKKLTSSKNVRYYSGDSSSSSMSIIFICPSLPPHSIQLRKSLPQCFALRGEVFKNLLPAQSYLSMTPEVLYGASSCEGNNIRNESTVSEHCLRSTRASREIYPNFPLTSEAETQIFIRTPNPT